MAYEYNPDLEDPDYKNNRGGPGVIGGGGGSSGPPGSVGYAGSPYAGSVNSSDPFRDAYSALARKRRMPVQYGQALSSQAAPAVSAPAYSPVGGMASRLSSTNTTMSAPNVGVGAQSPAPAPATPAAAPIANGSTAGSLPAPTGSAASSVPGASNVRAANPAPSYDDWRRMTGWGYTNKISASERDTVGPQKYKAWLEANGYTDNSTLTTQTQNTWDSLLKAIQQQGYGQERQQGNDMQALGMDDPSLYAALKQSGHANTARGMEGAVASAQSGLDSNILQYLEQLGLGSQSYLNSSNLMNQQAAINKSNQPKWWQSLLGDLGQAGGAFLGSYYGG